MLCSSTASGLTISGYSAFKKKKRNLGSRMIWVLSQPPERVTSPSNLRACDPVPSVPRPKLLMWQQRRHKSGPAFKIWLCEVMEQWQHSGPHSTVFLGRAECSSSLPSLGAELPRSLRDQLIRYLTVRRSIIFIPLAHRSINPTSKFKSLFPAEFTLWCGHGYTMQRWRLRGPGET